MGEGGERWAYEGMKNKIAATPFSIGCKDSSRTVGQQGSGQRTAGSEAVVSCPYLEGYEHAVGHLHVGIHCEVVNDHRQAEADEPEDDQLRLHLKDGGGKLSETWRKLSLADPRSRSLFWENASSAHPAPPAAKGWRRKVG